jgi:riboflavin biosynthesis pyrimidine reductase
LLFERENLPAFHLPSDLIESYAGRFGLPRACVFANFVMSVDGAVALGGVGESGHVISGDNEADRFVMGMLRACADAVLIGAGTFRASPEHLWHAEQIYPPAAAAFAELRGRLGLQPQPRLVLLTESGAIDTTARAISDALILTTAAGNARLGSALPASSRSVVLGSGALRLAAALQLLRREGFERVLTEGGPSLMGGLLSEHLVDELFLTVSPFVFGQSPGEGRKSLVHGIDLGRTALELLSTRRHGSHLFLRYAVGQSGVR